MAYHNPEIPGSSYETLEEAEGAVVVEAPVVVPPVVEATKPKSK